MRYYRAAFPKEHKITIYPLVCWHVGAPQADYEFIEEIIQRIKDDPSARWVYMGDGGECVTKNSKGMIYEQTMPPQDQLNWLVAKLWPLRTKGLFGVKGNHGWRTFKESGLGFDESLMLALQLPYLGTSVFWHLVVNRTVYDIFTHHGLDSSAVIGGKINKAKKFEDIVAVADAIFSAHSHICCEIPPVTKATLENPGYRLHQDPINWITIHEYICGCAYDSRTGYAEDKGYPPILPAHLAVTFGGGRTDLKRDDGEVVRGMPVKSQTCQIWRVNP